MKKVVIYQVGDTKEEQDKLKYTVRDLYSKHENLNEILGLDKSNIYRMMNGKYFGNHKIFEKILALVPDKKPQDIGLIEISLKEQKVMFSNKLNELLNELGFISLKQKENWLKENLNIASSTISKWLNAKVIPEDENLFKLAQKLHVSIYYLKGESNFRNIDNDVINAKTGLDEDYINRISVINKQSTPSAHLFDIPKSLYYDITPLEVMKYIGNTDFYNFFAQKLKDRYSKQLELQQTLKIQGVDIKQAKIDFEKNINKLKNEINCAIDDIYDELFFEKNNNDL